MRKYLKYIIIFILLVVFLYITELVLSSKLDNFDSTIYNFIRSSIMNNTLTSIFKVITFLGSSLCLVVITFILMIFLKNKITGLCCGINLIISFILNELLKSIVERPRPNIYRIVDASGYSYPSGHSMVSIAFYGFLIYLIAKNIKNKYLKYSLIALFSILILLIGFSRVYLGVHYVTDVIAGFLVGVSYLVLFIEIYKRRWIDGNI